MSGHERPSNGNHLLLEDMQPSSRDNAHAISRPSPLGMGALSEHNLSPILKSSSPQNARNLGATNEWVNDQSEGAEVWLTDSGAPNPPTERAQTSIANKTKDPFVVDQAVLQTVQEHSDLHLSTKNGALEATNVTQPFGDSHHDPIDTGGAIDTATCKKTDSFFATGTHLHANSVVCTPGPDGRRSSLEDLSSHQQHLERTSSAFRKHLRDAAESRKREVTRARYSMERKEQILYEEKEKIVQQETPAQAAEEVKMKGSQIPEVRRRKKKIDGQNPYKPFKALPLPSTTSKPAQPRIPKKTGGSVSQRQTAVPRKNPYIPFKSRPMPKASGPTKPPVVYAGGAKRKSSTAFQPNTTQNRPCHAKSTALHGKPPKRLLSGEDASTAKAMGQTQRLLEEEARLKKNATFKALPLPPTNQVQRSGRRLIGEDLVLPRPAAQGNGEENGVAFVPRSSARAIERARYDAKGAERERRRLQEQMELRNSIIDQNTKDIKNLKRALR